MGFVLQVFVILDCAVSTSMPRKRPMTKSNYRISKLRFRLCRLKKLSYRLRLYPKRLNMLSMDPWLNLLVTVGLTTSSLYPKST